jgi:putative oxidoreductase
LSAIVGIFLARCLLVMLFLPFSAADKILNRKQAVDQAATAVWPRSLAALLIAAGLGVEVVMSLGIITGVADRLAAFVLAVYCLVTAVLWKPFWKTPDFRLKGASQGRELLAFGTDASGLRHFFEHPLASSRPYYSDSKGGP